MCVDLFYEVFLRAWVYFIKCFYVFRSILSSVFMCLGLFYQVFLCAWAYFMKCFFMSLGLFYEVFLRVWVYFIKYFQSREKWSWVSGGWGVGSDTAIIIIIIPT